MKQIPNKLTNYIGELKSEHFFLSNIPLSEHYMIPNLKSRIRQIEDEHRGILIALDMLKYITHDEYLIRIKEFTK